MYHITFRVIAFLIHSILDFKLSPCTECCMLSAG